MCVCVGGGLITYIRADSQCVAVKNIVENDSMSVCVSSDTDDIPWNEKTSTTVTRQSLHFIDPEAGGNITTFSQLIDIFSQWDKIGGSISAKKPTNTIILNRRPKGIIAKPIIELFNSKQKKRKLEAEVQVGSDVQTTNTTPIYSGGGTISS